MLLALLLTFLALSFGLMPIGLVILVMGFAGSPGAILFQAGKKSNNAFQTLCGFVVCAIGQSFVVGAYAVFVVSLLRWYSEGRPAMPTWPLWIAAFFHSGAAPSFAMKERVEEPTAQHYTLGIVALFSIVVFLLMVLSPNILEPIYGWIPFYQSTQLQNIKDYPLFPSTDT